MIQYLVNVTRPFIFTTALPSAIAAAASAAIAVIQREPDRRMRLWSNRHRLFDGMQKLGFRLTQTVSPILPITSWAMLRPHQPSPNGCSLMESTRPPSRPPTVPDERPVRIASVTSEHTTDQIDEALHALSLAGRETGLL